MIKLKYISSKFKLYIHICHLRCLNLLATQIVEVVKLLFFFFDYEDRNFIALKKWALTPNKYTLTEAQKQKPHGMSHYMHYVKWMVLSPSVENKNMRT